MPTNDSSKHEFERRRSIYQQERSQEYAISNAWSGPPLDILYAGIAITFSGETVSSIAIAVRDATYLIDFLERHFRPSNKSQPTTSEISDLIISELRSYGERHFEKFVGVAMPLPVAERCPTLCSRLWRELDIVPLVLHEKEKAFTLKGGETPWEAKSLDELAESLSRKCIRFFGPNNNPLLHVGIQGLVEVDSAFHIRLANLADYQSSVNPATWAVVNHYASNLKKRKIKVAFFSATPQGGGVALMRHALVRLSGVLGTDIKWYVPKPRPGVFRITKKNHNILQGVSKPEDRLTREDQRTIFEWLHENAKRYWLSSGGPLTRPSEGGADIIVIDDLQTPGLIPLAKEAAPNRPVIFRSHIQIRSDLIAISNTAQADLWKWLWGSIQLADIFISHPVSKFVPHDVPREKIGYMLASTDRLDGLNKAMRDWDVAAYGRAFNVTCKINSMPIINYPEDEYIVQIARFDPSKGIFDVLESYAKFRRRLADSAPNIQPPKLLICGHGSVDDPQGTVIFDAVINYTRSKLPQLTDSICVMRLYPPDQILNALLSKAKIALQLSTREGFEIKVSEAILKGKPIIATVAGGISLQIQDQKNGFLVEVGDTEAVAKHLYDLWTDDALYSRMSRNGLETFSDEVSTVGNMVCWLYLAWKLTTSHKCKPNGNWISDMARAETDQPYQEDESKLKRSVEVEKIK